LSIVAVPSLVSPILEIFHFDFGPFTILALLSLGLMGIIAMVFNGNDEDDTLKMVKETIQAYGERQIDLGQLIARLGRDLLPNVADREIIETLDGRYIIKIYTAGQIQAYLTERYFFETINPNEHPRLF